MPITTLKRCQHDSWGWLTVENLDVEFEVDPGSGLCVKYRNLRENKNKIELSIGIEDALLIRDSINQLYPPDVYPAK
jgi:hypothetical protein